MRFRSMNEKNPNDIRELRTLFYTIIVALLVGLHVSSAHKQRLPTVAKSLDRAAPSVMTAGLGF
jgi:hypothetical protein